MKEYTIDEYKIKLKKLRQDNKILKEDLKYQQNVINSLREELASIKHVLNRINDPGFYYTSTRN